MPEGSESVVQTVGLTKVFRDFWLRTKVTAVSQLDLDIHSGEVFGLLGPNGSGKSTTLKMILGLLFPSRGQIAIFGRRPTAVAIKARIGFLPEESYLYPFLDAYETLDFYGRLFQQPRSERRRRIDMLLEMVGLSGVGYRRVGEYSKGMQRRIGLAQALINDPDLLILDEPTAGMDPIGTRQFKDLIGTLAMRGKTVILSSHLLADVEDVCDRVCILYGGRKRAEGPIEDLLAQDGRTQIITEGLDRETIDQVAKVLAARGKKLLEVGSPSDKLESLFLRIVAEAQQQRVATGGAIAGGEVAEFLRGTGKVEGRQVVEQLVSAGRPIEVEPERAEHEPAEAEEVAEEVIDDLIAGSTRQPHDDAELSGEAPPADKPQTDRAVIDSLLKKNSPKSQE